ncbi:NAC transcription factor 47-like, partial [Hibiscus syriacus]|uniref:NAC transcription factor 47-like n=1 Tax=Hibiscus syriacus TaxID=106335 RepID=UPI00192344B2
MKHQHSSLPPEFRFHPTDEELVLHYLMKKLSSSPFPVSIVTDVDIYKFDPWDLPDKAFLVKKNGIFFSPRDRKYPNGVRPNRAAGSGYWKATGTDKIIVTSSMVAGRGEVHSNIGVKKALVFYKGRPPKGTKTNWIMHEYRLSQSPNNNSRPFRPKDCSMRFDDWVLCRIYKKSHALSSTTSTATEENDGVQEEGEAEQFIQDAHLPALESPSTDNNNTISLRPQKSCSFSDA